jgi:phosphoketolase
MSDMVRVVFPADHNSVLALLPGIYQARGQLACMVIAKREQPCVFTPEQAELLAQEGAIVLAERPGEQPLLLIATGSYQLAEMQRAAVRLSAAGCAWRLVYLQEPGRFRAPRDAWEQAGLADAERVERIFPSSSSRRVLLTHMRAEVARGHLWPLLGDAQHSRVLGYRNRGGTLDEAGMLFANQATWVHVLEAAAALLEKPLGDMLSAKEQAAIQGQGEPHCLR